MSTVTRLLADVFVGAGSFFLKPRSRFIHESPIVQSVPGSRRTFLLRICLQNSETFSSAVLSPRWSRNLLRTFANRFVCKNGSLSATCLHNSGQSRIYLRIVGP
jgi:hypothetical protein